VFWLALLVLTILTWQYDPAGYSAGMPGPVFFILLGSPFVVALILGWQQDTIWDGLKAGVVGGTLFGLANMAGHLVWSMLIIARGKAAFDPPMAWWEFALEALGFVFLFGIVGFVLGLVGGPLGAWAATSRHRPRVRPAG
jgi:hypothetical protein